MRTRLLATTAAAALAAATLAGTGVSQAAPVARAVPVARAAPGAGGPGFSALAYSHVAVSGDASAAGLANLSMSLPAPCWVEPRFTGGDSYHSGDPQPSPDSDADSYWWWFASQQPGLYGVFGRIPGEKQAINKIFKAKQGAAGWWWVPAWVDAGVNGYACAYSLVQSLNYSAQYLKFQGPQHGGDAPEQAIDGHILADLARAELVLPSFRVLTNPAAGTPSDVNLPVWVWLHYNGRPSPSDMASVPTPAGALWAMVTTSPPQVSLSVSSPGQAEVHSQCGAMGSHYTGNPTAVPPCGVTFLAPSGKAGYTITVTAKWTVTWTASDSPQPQQFTSPPWPVPVQTGTTTVTVREVQAVNGPSSGG